MVGVRDDIGDWAVREVLNTKLEQNPERCPICTTRIESSISEQYDKACSRCGTQFLIDRSVPVDDSEYDRPIPSVVFSTTPAERIKNSIRRKSAEIEVLRELSDDDETEGEQA